MNLELVIAHIRAAQVNLENMPCGGVGVDGASQAELDEANEKGMPIEDEASYHQSQQAWLELQKAVEELMKGKHESEN